MQQRGEPHFLVLSRRLAHAVQSARRSSPARCPDCGRLAAVLLGRGPSLHNLRREQAPIVRPLHRYNALVRLLIRVHAHRSAIAFMSRTGVPTGHGRGLPVSSERTSPRAWGLRLREAPRPQAIYAARILPSLNRTRSAPRNSTRFAARYPARGHPCERFAAGLATRLAHHSGPRRLAIPYLAEDLHLLFFRQRDWRTPVWVNHDGSTMPVKCPVYPR